MRKARERLLDVVSRVTVPTMKVIFSGRCFTELEHLGGKLAHRKIMLKKTRQYQQFHSKEADGVSGTSLS